LTSYPTNHRWKNRSTTLRLKNRSTNHHRKSRQMGFQPMPLLHRKNLHRHR
jgi:hypothetical protein